MSDQTKGIAMPLSLSLKAKKYSPTRLLCVLGVHRWVGRERDYCWRWGCGAAKLSAPPVSFDRAEESMEGL